MEVGQTWLRRTALIYLQAMYWSEISVLVYQSLASDGCGWSCVSWFPALWLHYVQENVYCRSVNLYIWVNRPI